jgi:hypothetical protein
MSENLVGYSLYGDRGRATTIAAIIEGVASRKTDLAVAWGPMAGYFAHRQPVELVVTPIPYCPKKETQPFAFDISVGVRQGDDALRAKIDSVLSRHQEEIAKILDDFHVPRLPVAEAPSDQVPSP